MSAQCRSCGSAIRWERTKNGKAIPLDPEPTPDGNVQIGLVGGESIALVVAAADRAAAQIAEIPLYLSHFATCPNAAEHRRS